MIDEERPKREVDLSYEHALFNMMKDASGRHVLFQLFEDGGLNAAGYTGENPLTAAYRAGKRDVCLRLWDRMRNIDLGLVRLMEDEAIQRAEARKGRK